MIRLAAALEFNVLFAPYKYAGQAERQPNNEPKAEDKYKS